MEGIRKMNVKVERIRSHAKRRFFIGLAVFAPFALTIWVLLKIVKLGADLLTRPAGVFAGMIEAISSGTFHAEDRFVNITAMTLSVLFVLASLYFVGLLSATLIGRRLIEAGEGLLQRIPGMQFCYNTIKQVAEILSRPRSRAFQKVVMIEYPRKGIRGLAFYSGITRTDTGDILISIFIPTTPNPTSGFLLLMRPDEVWETSLTIPEATRFIISGGVVELEQLRVRPFPINEYLGAATDADTSQSIPTEEA